jgi:hypothetical protein
MVDITVLAKQPPGGRCTLYIRYAEAIGRHLGLTPRVKYPEQEAPEDYGPPALLVGETPVPPSDGVILSPGDLFESLRGCVAEHLHEELRQLLEGVEEQMMEEWANG